MWPGLILGILTAIGEIIILKRAPQFIQRTVRRFPFAADILATIANYLMLSGISSSLASAIGAAISGIIFSLFIKAEAELYERKPESRGVPTREK